MQLVSETVPICVETASSFFQYYGTLKDFCLENSLIDFTAMFETRINCEKETGCDHSLDCCYH